MHRFDEKGLTEKIGLLSLRGKVIFTVACATRLLPVYEEFCERTASNGYAVVSECLEYLWAFEEGDPGVVGGCEMRLRLIEKLISDARDPAQSSGDLFAQTEDTIFIVLYAFETALSNSAQTAAGTARRVYNCLDKYVINSFNADINEPGIAAKILSNPIIQTELIRQERDVSELRHLDTGNAAEILIVFKQRAGKELALFNDTQGGPTTES